MVLNNQESKGCLEIGVKFGVPALIAIYLVYILAGETRAGIKENTAELHNLNKTLLGHTLSSETQGRELSEIMNRLYQVAQEQCINGALMAERSPKECLK